MDGINGITSLIIICWGITALLVGRAHGLELLSVVGAVSAGSALGFLPWNAPVAKLFLGDVGSYLFGGLVAVGLLLGWIGGVHTVVLIAPLALYLADTGTALTKRALRGDSLVEAHREHIYQRLVREAGLSHLAVAVTVGVTSMCITATVAFGSTCRGRYLNRSYRWVFVIGPNGAGDTPPTASCEQDDKVISVTTAPRGLVCLLGWLTWTKTGGLMIPTDN
jgi:UDP-N-acetylmuramyl pentapeptide phosphotransferase/UDP-N-acetylglucosamine-1-phosphate transferase